MIPISIGGKELVNRRHHKESKGFVACTAGLQIAFPVIPIMTSARGLILVLSTRFSFGKDERAGQSK